MIAEISLTPASTFQEAVVSEFSILSSVLEGATSGSQLFSRTTKPCFHKQEVHNYRSTTSNVSINLPLTATATPAGYIFRCSGATQQECFDRKLFGEANHKKHYLSDVKKDDYLFLYNVHTHDFYGTYIALSDITENLVPEAWEGKFPLQVQIGLLQQYANPLTKEQILSIVQFGGEKSHLPRERLSPSQVRSLMHILQKNSLQPYQDDFHKKYPPLFRTMDGHSARSFNEVVIDDWLFARGISHANEQPVPVPEMRMQCDFVLPLPDHRGLLYIEYWGMNHEKYEEQKMKKIALYKKHTLPLVELLPEDVENIDTVLPEKLGPFYNN